MFTGDTIFDFARVTSPGQLKKIAKQTAVNSSYDQERQDLIREPFLSTVPGGNQKATHWHRSRKRYVLISACSVEPNP